MPEDLVAIVRQSALTGRQIVIEDASGFAHYYIALGETAYSMEGLTSVLADSGYKRLGPWMVTFNGTEMSLRAAARED